MKMAGVAEPILPARSRRGWRWWVSAPGAAAPAESCERTERGGGGAAGGSGGGRTKKTKRGPHCCPPTQVGRIGETFRLDMPENNGLRSLPTPHPNTD